MKTVNIGDYVETITKERGFVDCTVRSHVEAERDEIWLQGVEYPYFGWQVTIIFPRNNSKSSWCGADKACAPSIVKLDYCIGCTLFRSHLVPDHSYAKRIGYAWGAKREIRIVCSECGATWTTGHDCIIAWQGHQYGY